MVQASAKNGKIPREFNRFWSIFLTDNKTEGNTGKIFVKNVFITTLQKQIIRTI